MRKNELLIVKICGAVLILMGFYSLLNIVFPLKLIISKEIPDDAKKTVYQTFFITLTIVTLFASSFISSGIGVIKLKEWGRKLSICTVSLQILLILPLAVLDNEIAITLVWLFASILMLYCLMKKSIKNCFMKDTSELQA